MTTVSEARTADVSSVSRRHLYHSVTININPGATEAKVDAGHREKHVTDLATGEITPTEIRGLQPGKSSNSFII